MTKTKLYTFYMSLYGSMCSKWCHWQLHGCHLGTCGEQRVRDLDKSTTQFCQGWLTTATRLVQFVLPLYK